jgi:hypothetical protein
MGGFTNTEKGFKMTTATAARINRAMVKEGLTNIEFVRGEGYCYFIYDEAPHFFETESVYVPYVNSMPLDRWLEIGRDFHAACQHAAAN